MSRTRIACQSCGFVQVYCTCKDKKKTIKEELQALKKEIELLRKEVELLRMAQPVIGPQPFPMPSITGQFLYYTSPFEVAYNDSGSYSLTRRV